jgi:hypothetical protein
MKKVIYTSLVGAYDVLKQPLVIDYSYDYICYSNDFDTDKIGVWTIKKIPYSSDSKTRLSRYVKIQPHKVLKDYDYSVWIDSNLQIKTEAFYAAIEKQIANNSLISQVPHTLPPIDCVYDEIKYALKLAVVSYRDAKKQYQHLKQSGFPKHFGLLENNIIFRDHNNELVKKISDSWWDEYLSYTNRDQFSLMFVYWQNNFFPTYLFGPNTCTRNSDCIIYHPHVRILSKITLSNIIKSLKKQPVKYSKRLLALLLVHFID